ncbi:NAD(P)-binding protein [Coprinellus micaceus]|uniref:NAD(P)-binding protein n=1 Tax=Coprinellus micaceus TaxID=71717 RepID=A0A4Y7T079_COPMI|nr:NAD(P)-binding protein [Coprinellus micaceus]
MTTLITGGGSATGVALAKLLKAAGHDVLFASRSGQRIPEGFAHVKLDWSDPATFGALFSTGRDIQYVYLLLAGVWDPLPQVKPFIDLAVEKGVKRIVLLSASGKETERGPASIGLGQVHTYLHDKGVDYVALRPTWFSENFLRGDVHNIKADSELQSIHPKGRVPFIAVQDIAEAAFDAITNVDALPSRETTLIGPELVTYDEVVGVCMGMPFPISFNSFSFTSHRYHL